MLSSIVKTFRYFAKGALAIGALVGMAGSNTANADEWKCYTYQPSPTHPTTKSLETIMQRFRDEVGGKIDYRCNVGGSLPIEANSIVTALGQGVIDFADTSFVSGVVPVAGLTSLPGLFGTQDEMKDALEVAWPTLVQEFERQGAVPVAAYLYPRQVLWSKGPLNSLADLKGKNVRVLTLEQTEFVKGFGGVPVTIGTPEVAMSLERSVITVVLTAASGGGRLWIDLLDHMTEIGPNFSASFFLASKESFDALTSEEQAALGKIAQEEADKLTQQLNEENSDLVKEFVATKGLTVTPTDPEQERQLTDAMKGYWETWAEQRGDVALKLLAEVRAKFGR
jgi:TRAP-type C4-dicarboxylate transport system substrate-binding protein